MPFVEISGKNIRNLQDYSLKPSPYSNLVFGKNGAGKTSLLEAVYLNSLGRSFKTHSLSNIIKDTASSSLVFSRYIEEQNQQNHKIGLQRWRGNKQAIKIDDKAIGSLAPLAKLIPILSILPDETQLIDGPSSLRRKYLDWIMFHVEPSFLSLWKEHQKLLKQRNHLLRGTQKATHQKNAHLLELSSWDKLFVEINEGIDELRKPVFSPLIEKTQEIVEKLPAFDAGSFVLEGVFYKGWGDKASSFREALEESLSQDLKSGYTKLGAHRADFLLNSKGKSVKERLSSGQKKLLSVSLRLAQAQFLKERTGRQCVLLVDDLFAELDINNAEAFVGVIESLGLQAFFTSLSGERDRGFFKKEPKMFHVEQGRIDEYLE